MAGTLSKSKTRRNFKTRFPGRAGGFSRPTLDIPDLCHSETGSRVSVLGRIVRLAEEQNPKGLWIEMEEAGEGVELWLEEPVAQAMKPLQLSEGDIIIGSGVFNKEEGPLLGTIDVRNPSDIIPLR